MENYVIWIRVFLYEQFVARRVPTPNYEEALVRMSPAKLFEPPPLPLPLRLYQVSFRLYFKLLKHLHLLLGLSHRLLHAVDLLLRFLGFTVVCGGILVYALSEAQVKQ